jgi:hypothetical protein
MGMVHLLAYRPAAYSVLAEATPPSLLLPTLHPR